MSRCIICAVVTTDSNLGNYFIKWVCDHIVTSIRYTPMRLLDHKLQTTKIAAFCHVMHGSGYSLYPPARRSSSTHWSSLRFSSVPLWVTQLWLRGICSWESSSSPSFTSCAVTCISLPTRQSLIMIYVTSYDFISGYVIRTDQSAFYLCSVSVSCASCILPSLQYICTSALTKAQLHNLKQRDV